MPCNMYAHAVVKEVADYVCDAQGGYGAVREVCDHLLNAREET